MALSMWVGTMQSVEGLSRTKMQRKREFSLLAEPSFFCPRTLDISAPRPLAFGLRLRLIPSLLLPQLNCIIGFPPSPVCRWQTCPP